MIGQRQIASGTFLGFSFVPWLVLATALVTLAGLFILPQRADSVLAVLFPVWAVILTFGQRENILSPVCLLPAAYLCWFWFGSLNLLPGTNLPMTLLDPIPARQWVYYLLGFIGYLGAVLCSGKPKASPERILSYRPTWGRGRIYLFLGVVFFVTLAAWLMIAAREGIAAFSANVNELRVEIPERHHMAFQIEVIGAYLLLPLIFAYLWTGRPSRVADVLLWGAAGFLVFMLISQGNRGTILGPTLTILVMRHFLVMPWKVTRAVPIVLLFLLVVGITGYYRSLQQYGENFVEAQIEMGVPPPLQPYADIYFYIRAPISTFRDTTVLVPSVVGYQWGKLSFGAFSQLLPGRHPSSDYFFKDLLRDTFTGFGEPASMLGTLYADFGSVGIFVGMAGIGFLMAQLYRAALVTPRIHWILIYSYYWQKFVNGFYGSFIEYIVEILVPLAWFILLAYYVRPRAQRLQPEPAS
jgi:oligosaccharide repeat unit polymerase